MLSHRLAFILILQLGTANLLQCAVNAESPNASIHSSKNPQPHSITKSTSAQAGSKADKGEPTGSTITSACTEAQLWALACPALLAENNGHRHDLLWCLPATEENIKKEKRALSEWWGINSREDLLKNLNWLVSGGHREQFDNLVKFALGTAQLDESNQALSQQSPQEFEEKLKLAKEYAPQLGFKSLLGWDYCRYIALCRWGTLCGYMSQEEAWQRIMPAARLLQNSFPSWKDLGANYLMGRRFWRGDTKAQENFEKCYKTLLTDPNSPWVKIPWKTNLAAVKQKQ